MTSAPLSRRAAVPIALLAAFLLAACERGRQAPARDSTAVSNLPAPPSPAAPGATQAWDPSVGPALIVPAPEGDGVSIVPALPSPALPSPALPSPPVSSPSVMSPPAAPLPGGGMQSPQRDSTVAPEQRPGRAVATLDTAQLAGAEVELFAREGLRGAARLVAVGDTALAPGRCRGWPPARLSAPGGDMPADNWTVGLVSGRARPVALEPIATLSPTDSARLAAEATRLASALPSDTAADFRGIPFAVRIAYRFPAAPGVSALAAEVVRKVNEEADPAAEHIFLVAERDSTAASDRYRTAYAYRRSGGEAEVVSTELLAAITLGAPPRTTLVLDEVGYAGDSYALLERVGPLTWRVRWRSAYADC